jgi:hypothetical protein
VRFITQRLDPIADCADLLVGRLRLHHHQHESPLCSNESRSLLYWGSVLQM